MVSKRQNLKIKTRKYPNENKIDFGVFCEKLPLDSLDYF